MTVILLHRNKASCSELNPVQSSRSKSTTCLKKGVCSDSNPTAQLLPMAACKCLKTMSGMILIQLQPKVCSDSNPTAQLLPMAACKCLKTMSGMILIQLQPKFAAESVANEIQCLKAM